MQTRPGQANKKEEKDKLFRKTKKKQDIVKIIKGNVKNLLPVCIHFVK